MRGGSERARRRRGRGGVSVQWDLVRIAVGPGDERDLRGRWVVGGRAVVVDVDVDVNAPLGGGAGGVLL